MNGVTREGFLAADDPKVRDGLLYDMLEGIHESIHQKLDTCQGKMKPRVEALENGKNKDTATSLVGGFLGGFAAIAAKLLIWR
jgi:hypothetical protein